MTPEPGKDPVTTGSHTEKTFQNIIKSTQNQIVFTIFGLIWIETDFRLVPNQSDQSENGIYNLISGWFKKISIEKNSFCLRANFNDPKVWKGSSDDRLRPVSGR